MKANTWSNSKTDTLDFFWRLQDSIESGVSGRLQEEEKIQL